MLPEWWYRYCFFGYMVEEPNHGTFQQNFLNCLGYCLYLTMPIVNVMTLKWATCRNGSIPVLNVHKTFSTFSISFDQGGGHSFSDWFSILLGFQTRIKKFFFQFLLFDQY